MPQTTAPKIAVVGCGYWGKNLVRNFHALNTLACVCDASEQGRKRALEIAPGVPVVARLEDLSDFGLDGAVIATPAETHAEIALELLRIGCDLLIEKPLALRIEDAEKVLRAAEHFQKIVMVGHVLEYHPGIERLHELLQQGELGTLRYIYSNRLNLGKIRREENILWSFAPHDIAVILRLVGALPFEVVCTGGNYIQANIADVTVTHLLFDNHVRAHIFVSWLHPYKEQRLIVVGSKKMAVFDDVKRELTVFDQHIAWQNGEPLPVGGGKRLVEYSAEEPLRRECQAFVQAIRTRIPPVADGDSALRVLEVLCAAQRSLVTHGHPVQLASPARCDMHGINTGRPIAEAV